MGRFVAVVAVVALLIGAVAVAWPLAVLAAIAGGYFVHKGGLELFRATKQAVAMGVETLNLEVDARSRQSQADTVAELESSRITAAVNILLCCKGVGGFGPHGANDVIPPSAWTTSLYEARLSVASLEMFAVYIHANTTNEYREVMHNCSP